MRKTAKKPPLLTAIIDKLPFLPEGVVFLFALLTRFIRINTPGNHMFDEVYHAYTAQEMMKGNPAAWEWWNTPPTGFAYEWTHPPLAKEFMVVGMKLFGENVFGWRFFSAMFGTGIIILIYLIALKLFRNRIIALIAATAASLDGLLLTTSRIAMNDAYFVFFSLLALYLFLNKRFIFTGLALGLALASKWTGLYGMAMIVVLFFISLIAQKEFPTKSKKTLADTTPDHSNTVISLAAIRSFIQSIRNRTTLKKILISLLCFIVLPIVVYVACYIPFFVGKPHIIPGAAQIAPRTQLFEKLTLPPGAGATNWETFINLQEQMWWYHTRLKATHAFQSRPWEWVLDMASVWFWVDYKDKSVANIYAIGNPLVFWFGFIAVLYCLWNFIRTRSYGLAVILVGYFGYFLPWVISPRIMFLYHYTPAVPFLTLATGYVLYQFIDAKTLATLHTYAGLSTKHKFLRRLIGMNEEDQPEPPASVYNDPVGTYVVLGILAGMLLLFIYFFPLYTGIHIPTALNETYYWMQKWRYGVTPSPSPS